jgi:predicted transcriptional regulator
MYDLISFLSRSKNRKKVLENLENPTSPTKLASKLKIQRSTISRAILELMDKKLVKCLTPKEKMGRLYQITKLGKKIDNKIKEDNDEI